MRPSPPFRRSRLNSEKKKRKEKTISMSLAIHGMERIYIYHSTEWTLDGKKELGYSTFCLRTHHPY